jgi:hypothetical protein
MSGYKRYRLVLPQINKDVFFVGAAVAVMGCRRLSIKYSPALRP